MSVTVSMDTQRSPFSLQHKDSWKVNGINLFSPARHSSHWCFSPWSFFLQNERFWPSIVILRGPVAAELCVFKLQLVGNCEYI